MSNEGNGSGAGSGPEPGAGPESGNGSGSASRTPRRHVRMATALFAVFLVGAVGGGALVMTSDAWSHGGRWGWGGMKGHHGDPDKWKEHIQKRADRWLDRVDATEEQREAIGGVVGEAVDTFAGAIAEHRSLHDEWRAEFVRPELDAEALEALRARHLELADRKSRQALDTVLQIGSVLTAEQREEIVAKFDRHRDRRHKRGRDDEG